MKLSIRMKIFLPVVILLIGFPLATWATLRYSLEVHMNFNARRDLEAMVRTVDGVLEEPEDGEEGDTVLSRLRDAVQTGAGEARMLVVSEKYRVVYPKNFDDQADMSQIYSAFLNAATDDESFWEQDKILEETIEEKEYLLYYKYVTPSEREKDQKVRHILLYCPVHDTTAMMDQITRVVLLTMSVIAAAAIALFWLVAGSISVPVQRLCEAARGIGEKKFKRVETGSSVVNYATQFVGNPYVWGGTSLTNGADCSGFVQSVYANFGVSLPRTSYEQQNAGTEVSYADAQPGDLICYGGHVAIYMGNGQIVHASNSQDGIKVSNDATYRTIVSVRRLV